MVNGWNWWEVLADLKRKYYVDFTTKGRKSGEDRRLEIKFHIFDDKVCIAGLRGKKDWYANLVVDANFTLHLRSEEPADIEPVEADVPVQARLITDDAERRKLFPLVIESYASDELTMEHIDEYIETGHIIEVQAR
jgi:hypothetical protein